MLKNLLLLILFVTCGMACAQRFPTISGTLLDGKATTIPANNKKFSVVAIAFHRGAEDDLKKWLNPLYDAFIKKEESKGSFDMADVYDVNFVFIPLISGFKRIADEFKSGTDKVYWSYIMDTEKTDIKALQKQLGVEDTRIPYFFVLDAEGKIVEKQTGGFSEKKLEKMESVIQ